MYVWFLTDRPIRLIRLLNDEYVKYVYYNNIDFFYVIIGNAVE